MKRCVCNEGEGDLKWRQRQEKLPAISFEEVLKNSFGFHQSLVRAWQGAYHKLEDIQTHRQVTACLKQSVM